MAELVWFIFMLCLVVFGLFALALLVSLCISMIDDLLGIDMLVRWRRKH